MLAALRRLPSDHVLWQIAIHLKLDPTSASRKNLGGCRWQVLTTRGDFEILATASLWYDTREKRGGGAIALAMHLLDVSVVEAAQRLSDDGKWGQVQNSGRQSGRSS